MTQRDRFEAWAAVNGFNLTRHDHGGYYFSETASAWRGWQAACPDSYRLAPIKITAESGHKYALMGEFSEAITLTCPDCDSEKPGEYCEICNGTGKYEQSVDIKWDTIKRIYDRIVSVSAPPETPDEIKGWHGPTLIRMRELCEGVSINQLKSILDGMIVSGREDNQ